MKLKIKRIIDENKVTGRYFENIVRVEDDTTIRIIGKTKWDFGVYTEILFEHGNYKFINGESLPQNCYRTSENEKPKLKIPFWKKYFIEFEKTPVYDIYYVFQKKKINNDDFEELWSAIEYAYEYMIQDKQIEKNKLRKSFLKIIE